MAKRRQLGNMALCRLPSEPDSPLTTSVGSCLTEKTKTFCVGDRVQRADVKGPGPGSVIALSAGRDNRGKKKMAARVCWDSAERNELAYPYLFVELKKAK